MSSIMTAVIAGAVGGAMGGVVSTLIARRTGRRPGWLMAFPVGFALVTIGMVRAADPIPAADIMAALDSRPDVELLKTYYPTDYARLERQVAALSSSAKLSDIKAATDQVIGDVAERQRPKANAETSRQMYIVAHAEGRALRAFSAAACSAFLDGAGRAEDLAMVMTPELAALDVATTRLLLTQTATKPAPPASAMSTDDLAALSQPALSKLNDAEQDVVIRVLQEQRGSRSELEHRVMCDFYLAQAEAILNAPPAIAGARVRALWAIR
ncbi:MAG: hypothetical protein KKE02_22380 [Alphaproteobacteria bacterium]|nr:hypothetical protein [Alphaproteobacteria bacterium]MBU1516093.1 hypothetical protein [Alphaproteobacteria bacterium]MBU2092692.1 hypothetical protein [Alphaproteobacteria bacterium]MBU2153783.1 hypothetical protein [Alphaproteobacteria bacterium]MBU2308411.1 hypothetical protein [Alphaproteobacteria bacterium]